MKIYYLFAVLPFLLLQACAPKPIAGVSSEAPLPPSSAGEVTTKGIAKPSSNKQAAAISSWHISGAMGVVNKAKHKAYSGNLQWAQFGPGQYNIRLLGPLGGGTVLINKQGNTVTYKSGAKSYTSDNADKLLAKHAGIHLPVSSLYYWVRGLAAPGSVQSAQYDKAHQLALLRQNGYTISFPRYTSINGIALPSMIRVDGQGVSVKLAIKNWKI